MKFNLFKIKHTKGYDSTLFNNSTNFFFKGFYKTKGLQQNKIWMVSGFAMLLNHGIHVVQPFNVGYGKSVIMVLKGGRGFDIGKIPQTFLNIQSLWIQWRGFCLILNTLKHYNAGIIPIADRSLTSISKAIGWSFWCGSQLSWRSSFLTSSQNAGLALIKSNNMCLMNLTSQLPYTGYHKWWYKIPSIGVLTLPRFNESWSGFISTHKHPLLQYFVLTLAWRKLHSSFK